MSEGKVTGLCVFVGSEGPERLFTELGLAQRIFQVNTTMRIVDNPVPECLTQYMEVVKLASHERVQRRFDVDLLVPQEVAKEIREVIADIEAAREETLKLTKRLPKEEKQPGMRPENASRQYDVSVWSGQEAELEGCKSVWFEGAYDRDKKSGPCKNTFLCGWWSRA